MKVYLFYLKPKMMTFSNGTLSGPLPVKLNQLEFMNITDTARLYAYTDDKALSDSFRELRDMTKFNFVKTKMSHEMYMSICAKYPREYLQVGRFYTRDQEDPTRRVPATVTCTSGEEEITMMMADSVWEYAIDPMNDPSLLRQEYRDSLQALLYNDAYSFYKKKKGYMLYEPDYDSTYNSYGPACNLILEEFREGYAFDEMALFGRYYGGTFKQ